MNKIYFHSVTKARSRLTTFSSEHNGITFLYRFLLSKPDCKADNYYKDLKATHRFLTSSITRWSYPTDRVLITFSFGPGIRDTPSIAHQMLIPFEMSIWQMSSTIYPRAKLLWTNLQHPEPLHQSCPRANTRVHLPPGPFWEALLLAKAHQSPT